MDNRDIISGTGKVVLFGNKYVKLLMFQLLNSSRVGKSNCTTFKGLLYETKGAGPSGPPPSWTDLPDYAGIFMIRNDSGI